MTMNNDFERLPLTADKEVVVIPAITIPIDLLKTIDQVSAELDELLPQVAALSERMRPVIEWTNGVWDIADDGIDQALDRTGIDALWIVWHQLAAHALAAADEKPDYDVPWFDALEQERESKREMARVEQAAKVERAARAGRA